MMAGNDEMSDAIYVHIMHKTQMITAFVVDDRWWDVNWKMVRMQ